MAKATILTLCMMAVLAGCSTSGPGSPQVGADGRLLPVVYRIDGKTSSQIPFRVQDSVNALRAAKGLVPMQFNAALNAAAAAHSQDMAAQARPWHFGSDGSSPLLRAQRAGYPGRVQGELVSETYESEIETIGAWAKDTATRGVLLDPTANEMGFAWYQEQNGKIWWTMITGDRSRAPLSNVPVIALGRTVTSEMDNIVGQ